MINAFEAFFEISNSIGNIADAILFSLPAFHFCIPIFIKQKTQKTWL